MNIYIYIFYYLFVLQEWPEEKYPPWAHGPGYVVSKDIAEAIYELHKEGHLKVNMRLSLFLDVLITSC